MTKDLSGPERFWLGICGLVLACAVVAISANAGPLLKWAVGIVDWVKGLF